MKKYALLIALFAVSQVSAQQSPCKTDTLYRQFDFWVGEWDVYGVKGNKAGESRISVILDSCIILEEWTSGAALAGGNGYKGKSFNTYNAASKQWQQTWVDNAGGTIEFLNGKYADGRMLFTSRPFHVSKDTVAIRRLTFFNLEKNKVRQLGEISKDDGKTFRVEYDLEYRRRNQ